MKKNFLTLIALIAISITFVQQSIADITAGKYGVAQVFDCQRSPAFPIAGQSFTASSLAVPYMDNGSHYTLGTGEYIQFFYVGGACSSAKVGINHYSATGTLIETISASGSVWGLENAGFLFVADNGDWGTFISNAAGYVLGGSVTYTTTTDLATCALLSSYVASTTPLNPVVVATVSTSSAGSITATTAIGNGSITDTGGANATVRGFCYGTSHNPDITGSVTTENGSFGTGAFTANISGLSASTLYYVRAYATNSAGTAYGTEVSFTTTASQQITFTVDMSTDMAFNPATDVVYISGNIFGWAQPGTNPAYQMTGPTNGSIYTIVATGLTPGDVQFKFFAGTNGTVGWGSGEWTGGANRDVTLGSTDLNVACVWADQSSSLTVVTVPKQITFTVDMSTDVGFNPATDVVYITGNIFGWAQPGTIPADQMTGPTNGSIYTIVIKDVAPGDVQFKFFAGTNGTVGWGSGEWSGGANRDITLSTSDLIVACMWGIPAPVAGSANTVLNTSFVATWSAVNDASSYVIDVATDIAFNNILTSYNDMNVGNVLSYSVTGLTAGTPYYYHVREVSTSVESANSNTITAITVPAAPTTIAASGISTTGFTANWSASNGATGYYLDVSIYWNFSSMLGGYNNTDVGNVTTLAMTGLADGTAYYYRVRAYNSGGTSAISNGTGVQTLNVAPVATAATSLTISGFKANWNAPYAANGYYLDVALDAGFTNFGSGGFSNTDVGNVTTYTVSGLTSGTTYYYRVRAYDLGGASANSNNISATTPATTTWSNISWDLGMPTPSSNAVITGTYTCDGTNPSIQCKNLTISAGKSLIVNPGYSVTVNGDLSNSGTVLLKSAGNATAPTGSLIIFGNATGNITVQLWLSANTMHYVSAPVANVQATVFNGAPTVKSYASAASGTWNPTTGNYTGTLTQGKGFSVTYTTPTTVTFTGVPKGGSFDFYSGILNNVGGVADIGGNPFPSAIDWNVLYALTTTKNICPTITYRISNLQTANYCATTGAQTNGGQRYIPAMQGFSVRAMATSAAVLTATNAVKVNATTVAYMKNDEIVDNSLKLKASGNNVVGDETMILFRADATTGFDDLYDGEKTFVPENEFCHLYSRSSEGLNLAINTLPETQSMDLFFRAGVSGNYNIDLANMNLNNYSTVVLEDLISGTFTNISNGTYSFAYATGSEKPFRLHFGEVNSAVNKIGAVTQVYSAGKFVYVTNPTTEQVSVNIYDLNGKCVYNGRTGNGLQRIALNAITGMYLVKVSGNSKMTTTKVMIQ